MWIAQGMGPVILYILHKLTAIIIITTIILITINITIISSPSPSPLWRKMTRVHQEFYQSHPVSKLRSKARRQNNLLVLGLAVIPSPCLLWHLAPRTLSDPGGSFPGSKEAGSFAEPLPLRIGCPHYCLPVPFSKSIFTRHIILKFIFENDS